MTRLKLMSVLFICGCLDGLVNAQNTTNSPGSMFGIGEVATGESGRYVGMGGVGIGLRKPGFTNGANPAGLTALDTLRFTFEAGLMAGVKNYSASGLSSTSIVGNLNNVSMAARIIPRWYGAVGIAPYSSVGYAITTQTEIEGAPGNYITSLFEGEGGLYKLYMTHAFLLTKRLSIGANLSYISGTIIQTETQSSIVIEQSSYKQQFHADFGLQYALPLSKECSLVIGATYGYYTYLNQDNELTVSSSSSYESIEESQQHVSQYIPQTIGAGVSYNTRRWLVAADYKYLEWSRMKEPQAGISYKDQYKVNIGASWLTREPYVEPVAVMAGFGVSNSYVVIKNQDVINWLGSAGVSIPLRGNHLGIGLKYLYQTGGASGVQLERSVSFYLNISFSEKITRRRL
ncbi:MAG: hypothetical protein LUD15_04890 [Bacteroides sp.]|nr:hypothetical protein [Bacteroides sp.]